MDILETLVERGLWESLGNVLEIGVSSSQCRWAIKEACKRGDDEDITNYVLRHCADDQLASVLTTLVERGLWQSVSQVLKRGVRDSQRKWAIEEVCKRGDDEDVNYILHYCADHLESVLTILVERSLWQSVGRVLGQCVRDSQCKWAIEEVCKRGDDEDIANYILHYCDDHLESVLTILVERSLWQSVGRVLGQCVSDSQRQWAYEEACKRGDDEDIADYILPHCADDQLESVLITLVERGLWQSVGKVFERVKGNSQHRWAIEEACKRADDGDIADYILPHCTESPESLLITLVERDLWQSVGKVLRQRGVCELQRRWAIDEACKRGLDWHIACDILPYCADDHLESVLITLVERGLLLSVGQVLNRGVSDSQHKWAIDEACKRGSDWHIACYILTQCTDDQLEYVLTILVERGLWQSVGKVLDRGVSDSQHKWATEEACKRADSQDIASYIQSHCTNNLESVLEALAERGLWESVAKVLSQGVRNSQLRWAIEEARKRGHEWSIIERMSPYFTIDQLDFLVASLCERGLWRTVNVILDKCRRETSETIERNTKPRQRGFRPVTDVLILLIERGLWLAVGTLLYKGVNDSQIKFAIRETYERATELNLLMYILPPYVQNYQTDCLLAHGLWAAHCGLLSPVIYSSATWSPYEYKTLQNRVFTESYMTLYNVLFKAAVYIVKTVCLRGHVRCQDNEARKLTEQAEWLIRDLDGEISNKDRESETRPALAVYASFLTLPRTQEFFAQDMLVIDRTDLFFALHFIKTLIQHCYNGRQWEAYTESFLVTLATLPVVPVVQSALLTAMLYEERWDVISLACLSHVWEQVRRWCFQAAVEQKQWNAVKKWADHTLYGDQRFWALKEALRQKQWDVMLVLADHGLTEAEVVRVHYLVAKYADWDTVCGMFERESDVSEVKELVAMADPRVALYSKNYDREHFRQRAVQLATLEVKLNAKIKQLETLKNAVRQGEWHVVMFNIRHRPIKKHVRLVLNTAIEKKAWRVVIQLVRLGVTDLPDSFFHYMVRNQQWGVCGALLQLCRNDSCVSALSKLMEKNQWLLVARLMEYDVGDAVRRQVMQRAMEMREGSIVWHCISTMQGDGLTVKEREELFQQAFILEVWQAVKPLTEYKDSTGIKQRDMALLEAIERHQWDVVDHCQRQNADINLQDEEGHTPIHRMARKEDWKAVWELTKRGGNPSLLDIDGLSVLHRALKEKQWEIAKLLILYHGDIHQAACNEKEQRTPLEMLIDSCQGEIIEFTLIWCPDQAKGVNSKGETALHAVCLSGWFNNLYYMVARGVNPFAVTKEGHSALFYAVLSKKNPQKIVAECIKLCFSTQQPHITDSAQEDRQLLVSPLVLAVMRGLPVVTQMLYESGACSNRELLRLNTQLRALTQTKSPERLFLQEKYWRDLGETMRRDDFNKGDQRFVKQSARYLMEVATTLRSLQSTCRLVISRCLNVRSRRHRHKPLPLPELLKSYTMFSDADQWEYDEGEKDDSDDDDHDDDDDDDNGDDDHDDDDDDDAERRTFNLVDWSADDFAVRQGLSEFITDQ